MQKQKSNIEIEKMRSYSLAFSRKSFTDVLEYDDFAYFDWLYRQYGKNRFFDSYFSFLCYLYSDIVKNYRCEYVYKNELINKLLLKRYRTKNTVYFNEFRVQNSIVDIAMFNGESKAFEIKTSLDTPQRLEKQMCDYKRLFDKCYLVIPTEKYDEYKGQVDEITGIILLSKVSGRIVLEEARSAVQNPIFDRMSLISCLRTNEYKDIVQQLIGTIPEVPAYQMFETCKNIIKDADTSILRSLFLKEIKNRSNNTMLLRSYPASLRQMMLCLGLSEKKAGLLIKKLNNPLNLKQNVLSISSC